jgi:argininosuccinate lyase
MQGDPLRTGRLGSGRPDPVAEFLSSMAADRWIAEADVLVDIAHLLMLERREILDSASARTLMEALLTLRSEGLPEEIFDDCYEDVHAGIEAYLIGRAGAEIGGRLHIGRSRNDEVATCIRMRLRHELLDRMAAILELRRVLIERAGEATETIMPGFTHLQHAQPTTLAHHLLAYEEAFGRDFERFGECFARVNRSPLGAAAFASTGYPIDRDFTAAALGFDGLAVNTMDAVAARDFALEAMNACSLLMSTVSRICEELVVWSSAFVRFVELDDAYCSTSSIMPQKKNPDTAEIMRAKAATVTGACMAAYTCMKGLPMSYNRDLQELTPHLGRAVGETGAALELLAGMIASARFDAERMREESAKGYTTATEVADMMVREFDLAFRTAHAIVGRAVRKGTLDLETLEEAAGEMASLSLKERGLTEDRIKSALDPEYGVSVRTAPGGPAPAATKKSIAERSRRLDADEVWVAEASERIGRALSQLVADAEEFIK